MTKAKESIRIRFEAHSVGETSPRAFGAYKAGMTPTGVTLLNRYVPENETNANARSPPTQGLLVGFPHGRVSKRNIYKTAESETGWEQGSRPLACGRVSNVEERRN